MQNLEMITSNCQIYKTTQNLNYKMINPYHNAVNIQYKLKTNMINQNKILGLNACHSNT